MQRRILSEVASNDWQHASYLQVIAGKVKVPNVQEFMPVFPKIQVTCETFEIFLNAARTKVLNRLPK